MAGLRTCLALALSIGFVCRSALAKPAFNSSVIEGEGSEIIFCDLDGDHLKDAVLIDGLNLSIFYQDSKQGFTRKPHQQYRLDDHPSVVFPARLGRDAECLLVMTSEGVTELYFTNRNAPPTPQQIIKQQSILPDVLDETQVMYFPLSASTGTEWPLLLVPVAGGLQVWSQILSAAPQDGQHRDTWRNLQLIEHAVDSQTQPSVTNPGYTQSFGLNMNLGDVDRDKRDDLMVMRTIAGGMQTYALYLQKADGVFTPEPSLTYTNKADWRTTLYWVDINGDGKLDLIKSTFLDEPFFVPGMRSGKVLVGVYLADGHGQIPREPQQIFRKNDWSTALPVVDLDGDGFVDLVLGYIPINPREGFRKAVTAQQVDFSLKFYFFRPGAGFPKDPDCQRDVLIHFHNEFFFTLDRRLYYEQFVSLNGDFSGDGKKDLLVRDHRDEISVYFFSSRQKGFNQEADLRFSCPESMDWWDVKDLNGDGVSDLVVKLRGRNAFRIFTSQSK